jgi:signal transduction histidine kinase/CHASE2 domain-containing sensor protein
MSYGSPKIRHASHAAWIIAIIVVSTMLAMIMYWRAPGLNFYVRDRLMQVRGPISPPDDIVIIAIDEASIARLGRFPWQRQLTARALDSISSAQPKAIALDILYSEPSISGDDAALADSIKRSGNTVVGAQLVETTDETGSPVARWLRPIPVIESSAAGIGHVNVSTEADGEARELPLRKSDDQGQALWSIAVETIRVGEGVRSDTVRDIAGGVRLGARTIPVAREVTTTQFRTQRANSPADTLKADRMTIDYVGPPGSFSHQTYSFVEVLDGRAPPQSLRGKYVLIGATAATLGDHVATPFVHENGPGGQQHGELMPGVEVLANSINTIVRSRFYRELPDWLVALLAALFAAAVLGSLTMAQGKFESGKQVFVLLALLAIILIASYVAFVHFLIVPPTMAALVSFATAGPLALLHRSLRASSNLDKRIAELTSADQLLPLSTPELIAADNLAANPAALIARLTGAPVVAIYARSGETGARYNLTASYGADHLPSLAEGDLQDAVFVSNFPDSKNKTTAYEAQAASTQAATALRLWLDTAEGRTGALILGSLPDRQVDADTLRLCAQIATSYLYRIKSEPPREVSSPSWRRFVPRGIEWKSHALGLLNQRMLARARFVDRALRSAEEGLIVADISGWIAFANPRAAELLGIPERALVGSDLFSRLSDIRHRAAGDNHRLDRLAREILMRLVNERTRFETELEVGGATSRYCTMRFSAVSSKDDGTGQILGLVAALTDVTQQHELQEMKTDVMTLVTHELRTPLTAIQGMSEVLAEFEVDDERRREMHLAINDEAKRLSHMINEYLDISKLESGARPLRITAVRIGSLVDRVLLLLDPVAAQRQVKIVRQLAPNLPGLLADADLIAQALTNLIANAIKYSPMQTEIIIAGRAEENDLILEVADHGYGIPAHSLARIFEKFYRVPRVEDADVAGTGLGLALVREIIELHEGRVSVKSEPGVGSTFSVRLPLSRKEN